MSASVLVPIGIVVIVIAVILLVVVFVIPTDYGSKKKKKTKAPEEPTEKEKELQAKITRLEKNSEALKAEMENIQTRERAKDKELTAEKDINNKLQDKLSQEKSWREREQETLDKKNKEAVQFKQDRLKLEQTIEEEHVHRLRAEHELKEMKRDFEAVTTEKRSLTSKVLALETSLEQYKKDLAEMAKTNVKLKERNESVAWIAKPEYDKLVELVKEKEKEIERLKRENSKP